MKIGIITFHWGTNYGAILQSYALQKYLQAKGNEVYIINYRPKEHLLTYKTFFSTLKFWKLPSIFKNHLKEQKLEQFRTKFLLQTMRYDSLKSLQSNPPELDMYICGSDQVWNPYFTSKGENNSPTPTYFLDFGNPSIKRVAYAVSFGCVNFPEDVAQIAKQYVFNIQAISVRENSGLDILKVWGIENAVKLADPTLLIQKELYNFYNKPYKKDNRKVYVYLLRNEKKNAKEILSKLSKNKYDVFYADNLLKDLSLEKWIENIATSSVVITNSYHGMIFSIIHQVPFAVLLAEGTCSGMNDRFITLLSYLGLEDRIVSNIKSFNWEIFLNKEINWKIVDELIFDLRKETDSFFENLLL